MQISDSEANTDLDMVSDDNSLPIIIVGSGMAGYTLARELRKLNIKVSITIVCRDGGDSYAKPTLSNAFAQGKLAETIVNANAEKMMSSLNLNIYNFYNVSKIDTVAKTITIHPIAEADKQQQLAYRDLVLATGAHSRHIPNVTVDQQSIFSINHLDDYKLFQQRINTLAASSDSPIKVAIIGAGLIGCEFANDLVSKNVGATSNYSLELEISIFDKAKLPLASQLPSEAGQALQTALSQSGVTFYLDADIISIHTTNQKVAIQYAIQNQTHNFEADIVLIAIGLVANTQLAEDANIVVMNAASASTSEDIAITHLPRTARQGIYVNQYLQTSAPHVYAIGDCANVLGSYMPYVMPLMNQAKALAKTLSDETLPVTALNYPAMPIAIKTPSLPIVALPVPAIYSDEEVNWQKTTTEDGFILTAHPNEDIAKVVGFVLVGKEAGKQRLTLAKEVADWL